MSTMSPKTRTDVLVAVTAGFGAIGVIAGAFGAHSLSGALEASGTSEIWKTAVFYNLVHAVAGLAAAARSDRSSRGPIWLWVAGVVLFSGSLYWMALGGPRWLGPITPIGGVLLVAGWLWLAIAAVWAKRERTD